MDFRKFVDLQRIFGVCMSLGVFDFEWCRKCKCQYEVVEMEQNLYGVKAEPNNAEMEVEITITRTKERQRKKGKTERQRDKYTLNRLIHQTWSNDKHKDVAHTVHCALLLTPQ